MPMPKRRKEDFGVITRGSTPKQLKERRDNVKVVKESGFHTQQWRVSNNERGIPISPMPSFPLKSIGQVGTGINLGPMGELGDDIIIAIKIKKTAEFKYVMGINSVISKQDIVDLFKRLVYKPIRVYLDRATIPHVGIIPTDRGNLADAIIKSYQEYNGSSNINYISSTEPLKVVLGAKGIPYGKVTNQMPTDWLKHPGTHGIPLGGLHKGSTRTLNQKRRRATSRWDATSARNKTWSSRLFDPMAKSHWYDELLGKSRQIASSQFILFKTKLKEIIALNAMALHIVKGRPLLNSRKVSSIVEKELFDIIVY